jgi:hypothetical protein
MKPQRSQRRLPGSLTCPLRQSTIASSTRPNTSVMRRKARYCGHTRLPMANGVEDLDSLVRHPRPKDNRPSLFATTSATKAFAVGLLSPELGPKPAVAGCAIVPFLEPCARAPAAARQPHPSRYLPVARKVLDQLHQLLLEQAQHYPWVRMMLLSVGHLREVLLANAILAEWTLSSH